MQTISQSIGSYRRRRLTLRTPAGLAAGGYTAEDTLEAVIWPGDDQTPVATPTAAWDDPAAATVWLTVRESDTEGLDPGTYRGRIWVHSQGRRIDGGDFALRLTASPGAGLALPSYCTLGDMERLATGWVDDLQDLDDDRAGFAEQRYEARRWVDRQLLARREAQLLDGHRVAALPPWPEEVDASLTSLRVALDADGLVRDGGDVARIAAHYALYLVCEPQVGAGGETPYQTLAARHLTAARTGLLGWRAAVDTDNDGVADLYLG